jgi:hypothetical protein
MRTQAQELRTFRAAMKTGSMPMSEFRFNRVWRGILASPKAVSPKVMVAFKDNSDSFTIDSIPLLYEQQALPYFQTMIIYSGSLWKISNLANA